MNSFSQTSRTVAIVTSVVGGLVLLGVGSTAAIATFGPRATGGAEGTQTIDVGGANGAGISGIEVESNAADFELVFDDVSEATLEVSGAGRSHWELSIDDGDLVVQSKRNFFDWCIGWCDFGEQQVTLTLPRALDSGELAAEFQVNSGSLIAGGNWRDLDIEVNAGSLNFDGAATSVDTAVSAGRANLTVDGVREADLGISAGQLTAELTGNTPRGVSVDVSAGKLDLTVPNGTYDVRSDVSAGSLDNRLDTASRSVNRVDVSVSAGSAVLRAG